MSSCLLAYSSQGFLQSQVIAEQVHKLSALAGNLIIAFRGAAANRFIVCSDGATDVSNSLGRALLGYGGAMSQGLRHKTQSPLTSERMSPADILSLSGAELCAGYASVNLLLRGHYLLSWRGDQ
jgi:hypothetical protein